MQSISEFEKTFVAKLDFFRKGKDFFVEAIGMAHVVSDPEEINCLVDITEEIRQKAFGNYVLVKVRLLNMHYFQSKKHHQAGPVTKIKETIYKMLFDNHYDYKSYTVVADNYA